ncbi:hypothetical protein C8R44DRAFT_791378 [Mycena epipterygia]|nr:hypothetical protein C8R44DRAFT_791378 [Mycena epipterygia]
MCGLCRASRPARSHWNPRHLLAVASGFRAGSRCAPRELREREWANGSTAHPQTPSAEMEIADAGSAISRCTNSAPASSARALHPRVAPPRATHRHHHIPEEPNARFLTVRHGRGYVCGIAEDAYVVAADMSECRRPSQAGCEAGREKEG